MEEIAAFCRYAYVGFFLQFLWNRMEADIDRSVDRLGELMTRHGGAGELNFRINRQKCPQ